MPGFSNSDNKFGPTPFQVDPILGNGANYSVIQSAINDCLSAGGGTVQIHPGTYTEDLVLQPSVHLEGINPDGRVPSGGVTIMGNHTLAGAGGCTLEGLALQSPAGDMFTLGATVAGQSLVFILKNCGTNAIGGRVAVANSVAGFTVTAVTFANIASDLDCFEMGTSCLFVAREASINSNAGGGVSIVGPGAICQIDDSDVNVLTDAIVMGDATSSAQLTNSQFVSSAGAIVNFTAAGTVNAFHNTYNSGAASTNYIEGAAGTYSYADEVLIGTATNIAVGITQTKQPWRPNSEAGVIATAYRGTSAFDATQFGVVDGFVQFATTSVASTYTTDSGTAAPVANNINVVGGNGSFITATGDTITVNSPLWSIVGASTAVTANSGSILNIGGAGTITLPTGVPTGSIIEIYNANTSDIAIQADVADIIRIGFNTSTSGGTATTNLGGDWLRLVYANTFNQWLAAGVVGNWTLA